MSTYVESVVPVALLVTSTVAPVCSVMLVAVLVEISGRSGFGGGSGCGGGGGGGVRNLDILKAFSNIHCVHGVTCWMYLEANECIGDGVKIFICYAYYPVIIVHSQFVWVLNFDCS